MTVEELKIILRVNGASTYTHTINEVTNVTNNYKNSIGSLTSTLAKLVSAAAITKFSKQCIQAASDLQEVANVTNVTFGQSANVVNEWAKKQAANFGLSETSAKRYIGTYGTMAKQFNFTTEQAASMGIELAKLTGDVASFYNIDDKLVSIKLKSIFTGETETLKDLGVVMTQAQLDAYALEKGIGRTTKQMSENEKVALRYSFVMDKLSHTQGDFARTSDGWANSVRLLKLNLENLKIEIGNQLLPVAGQGLAAINTGLQMLSPVLVNVAKTVRFYGEAWKNASDQTKGLIKASVSIFAIMAVAPRIIALVRAGIRLLSMEIVTLGGALKATMGILGIVLGAIAFKQLTDQMMELKKASETAESISDIGTSAETSSNAVDDLSEAMNGLGSATEGLDTFLASFDEVNKVGGNNSLMSNLVNTEDLSNILGVADGIGDISNMVDQLNTTMSELSMPDLSMPDLSKGTLMDPAWWQAKWKLLKGYFSTFFNGEWKENWNLGFDMIGQWFEEKFPKWSAFWEEAGAQWADNLQPVQAALQKISDFFEIIAEKFEKSAWFKYFAGAGANLYDLQHENDIENDDTFIYTSPSGVSREALKYYPDGSETELYKKYKSQYNEDGSETELQKRKKRSGTIRRYAAGGIPNKGSLFIAGETGPELISNFGSSQTKVINQSQITNNSTTQNQPIKRYASGGYPNKGSLFIAGETGPELISNFGTSQTKVINQSQITNNTQQPVMFQPTILIDGRKITATVVDNINTMTRSSGNSPLIQLG